GSVLGFGAVDISTAQVTGVLPTANGGTGTNLTGNSGGIPYFSTTTTMGTTATWTANTLLKGGGAGVAPVVTGVSLDASNNATGFGTIASGAITVTSTS